MTRYHCISCGTVWKTDDGKQMEGVSSGLCKPCLKENRTPVYRRKQLEEGNFDCFGKAFDHFCDQDACSYRKLCLV